VQRRGGFTWRWKKPRSFFILSRTIYRDGLFFTESAILIDLIMHSIAGGLLLKKSFMRRRWKGVPSCEAETLLSNTMERSNGEFINSLRLTRSFFLEIFGDILGIIYLSLYGVYTFLIYIPFSWLIPHKKKSLKDEVIVVRLIIIIIVSLFKHSHTIVLNKA